MENIFLGLMIVGVLFMCGYIGYIIGFFNRIKHYDQLINAREDFYNSVIQNLKKKIDDADYWKRKFE